MTFTYKRGIPLSLSLLASWAIAPIGASEISASSIELSYLYPGAEIQKSLPLSDIQNTCKYMVENYERLKNHLPLQNREIKGSDKWHIMDLYNKVLMAPKGDISFPIENFLTWEPDSVSFLENFFKLVDCLGDDLETVTLGKKVWILDNSRTNVMLLEIKDIGESSETSSFKKMAFSDGPGEKVLAIGLGANNLDEVLGDSEVSFLVLHGDLTPPEQSYDSIKKLHFTGGSYENVKSMLGKFPYITELKIPGSVGTINASLLTSCISTLEKIILEDGTDFTIDSGAFQGSNLTSLTIPYGVTNLIIDEYALNGSNLTSLTIPDSVTNLTIGDKAFYESNLASLTIPNSVTNLTIGSNAFDNCKSLTSLTISNSITDLTIGERAFFYCTNLTSLIISNSVTNLKISDNAFLSSKLTSLTIPNSVTDFTIGSYAFSSCPYFASLIIPDSVTNLAIGSNAFYGSNLTSLTIPDSVTDLTISDYAFSSTKLASLTISNSITDLTIGSYAFSNCSSLTSLTIPDGVTKLTIGGSAFYYCTKLTSLTIPDSITTLKIGSYAFSNCSSLTSLTIPDGVATNGIASNTGLNLVTASNTANRILKVCFYNRENDTNSLPKGLNTINKILEAAPPISDINYTFDLSSNIVYPVITLNDLTKSSNTRWIVKLSDGEYKWNGSNKWELTSK